MGTHCLSVYHLRSISCNSDMSTEYNQIDHEASLSAIFSYSSCLSSSSSSHKQSSSNSVTVRCLPFAPHLCVAVWRCSASLWQLLSVSSISFVASLTNMSTDVDSVRKRSFNSTPHLVPQFAYEGRPVCVQRLANGEGVMKRMD